MDIELETARLVMRRFTNDDLDVLVELDSDPQVMHYLTGGTPTPREVIQAEILPRILRGYDNGGSRWAAIERCTGAFLGWFALDPSRDGNSAEPELGYRLRRSAWGRGYATEGSRALVAKAFADGADRVWAETMAVNTASRRVLEKAGLRHVRTVHLTWPDPIEGTEHGEVEYELRRPDWEPGMTGPA